MKNLDAYKLKWIAIIGMFLNHAAMAFPEILPMWLQFVMYAAGGFTFPIMAFFVVEGYKYTSNLKKYLLRIFLFGVIAQIPHMIAFRLFTSGPNIMFLIFLGLVLLILYDKIKIRVFFWLIFVVAIVFTAILGFDWWIIGPVIMVMYHAISKESVRRTLPAIVAGAFYVIMVGFALLSFQIAAAQGEQYLAEIEAMVGATRELMLPTIAFSVGCFIVAYMIRHFSGERGKRMKYFFYIFYPVHFIVLAIIAFAFGLFELSDLRTIIGF